MTTLLAMNMHQINAYRCAANYPSVGQIYLLDNPLLQVPQQHAHIKNRMRDKLSAHTQYIHQYGEDLPKIRNREWLQ